MSARPTLERFRVMARLQGTVWLGNCIGFEKAGAVIVIPSGGTTRSFSSLGGF